MSIAFRRNLGTRSNRGGLFQVHLGLIDHVRDGVDGLADDGLRVAALPPVGRREVAPVRVVRGDDAQTWLLACIRPEQGRTLVTVGAPGPSPPLLPWSPPSLRPCLYLCSPTPRPA